MFLNLLIKTQWSQAHEKMFCVTHRQGNANQDHNSSTRISIIKRKTPKNKNKGKEVLVRLWKTHNPCGLLLGMYHADVEISLAIPQKVNHRVAVWLGGAIPGFMLNGTKKMPNTCTQMYTVV